MCSTASENGPIYGFCEHDDELVYLIKAGDSLAGNCKRFGEDLHQADVWLVI
jgi:hypothetical protein